MTNYFITWKNVIFNPELFFKNMPESGGYGEPVKFALGFDSGGFELR